jgi:hypothetical protein
MRRCPAFCYDGDVLKRMAWRHGRELAKHVLPAVIKPMHALWNEVIGFLFLCLGTVFLFKTVRYVMSGDVMRVCIAGACTFIMLWYGVTSFLKARKISRS